MSAPSDERCVSIAVFCEGRAKRARLEPNRRYEADIAAALRAISKLRALAAKLRRDAADMRENARDLKGAACGKLRMQAAGVDYATIEIIAILDGKETPPPAQKEKSNG